MNHYTSIEQSKKLLELGMNPESADMNYYYQSDVRKYIIVPMVGKPFDADDLSCWSLGALLEAMPSAIESNGHYYCLKIGKLANEIEWFVSYEWEGWIFKIMKGNLMDDAMFDMIVWLLENGYIKKDEDS